MAVDPAAVALYIPRGLSPFKNTLFEDIGRSIEKGGGQVIRYDAGLLDRLPDEVTPIVGCMPECTALIAKWRASGRRWAYWDRGYCRRVFATWLPRADTRETSFYRWHVGCFQLQAIREVPPDRWKALKLDDTVRPWVKNGRHIVIAAPTRTYARFHRAEGWLADTLDALARVTDRQLVIRDKESRRSLQSDLEGAHALVTSGSIAAVEAVVLGCPVFVTADSAAALVGKTDLGQIEKPAYPNRERWLWNLAASQYNETEMVDGTLWRTLT